MCVCVCAKSTLSTGKHEEAPQINVSHGLAYALYMFVRQDCTGAPQALAEQGESADEVK